MFNYRLYRNHYNGSDYFLSDLSEEKIIEEYLNKTLHILTFSNDVNFSGAKLIDHLKTMFSDHLKESVYFISDENIHEKITKELTISYLLQLLYDITFYSYENYYVPLENVFWYQQAKTDTSILTYKDSSYICETFDRADAINNMENNELYKCSEEDIKLLTKKINNILKESEDAKKMYFTIKQKKYINKFPIHYLRFLLYNKNLLNDILKKLKTYSIKEIQNKYQSTLEPFAENYNEFIRNAAIYLQDSEIDLNSDEYYIFLYQLQKSTKFLDILDISKYQSHDYNFASQYIRDFDTKIKYKTKEYIAGKTKHIGLEYGEDMNYYVKYITMLMDIDMSPTLFHTMFYSMIDLRVLFQSTRPFKNFFEFTIDYVVSNTCNFSVVRNRIVETLNLLISDDDKYNFEELLKQSVIDIDGKEKEAPIIGKDYQNLCFFVLQKVYNEK